MIIAFTPFRYPDPLRRRRQPSPLHRLVGLGYIVEGSGGRGGVLRSRRVMRLGGGGGLVYLMVHLELG